MSSPSSAPPPSSAPSPSSATPPPGPLSYNVSSLTIENYFSYTPSAALAWTAASLYLAIAFVVVVQMVICRNKNARYMWLAVLTAAAECGGYIALIWMTYNTGKTSLYPAYVAFQCLVVLSPNILQAAVYRTVGQISRVGSVAEKGGCLSATFIAWGFLAFDGVCLVVQAVGISIWASEKSSGTPNVDVVKVGSYITVAGLGMQLASFAGFLLLAWYIQKHEDNKFKGHKEHRWLYWGVYLSIFMVTCRNIFRFVEFLQGAIVYPAASSIADNQALFYCLETLPILLAFLALIVFSPTFLLPKTRPLEEYLGERSDPFDVESKGGESGEVVETKGDVAMDPSKSKMETVELD